MLAWVIATARASAASSPASATPGSRTLSMAWIWCFSAPPVPTSAFLMTLVEYSATGMPERARLSMATPRAWPSLSVDCGLTLTKTSSTAPLSGRWRRITSVSSASSWTSRSAMDSLASVRIWPLATCDSRLPDLATRPQPVQVRPGSTPRMIMPAPAPVQNQASKGPSASSSSAAPAGACAMTPSTRPGAMRAPPLQARVARARSPRAPPSTAIPE